MIKKLIQILSLCKVPKFNKIIYSIIMKNYLKLFEVAF